MARVQDVLDATIWPVLFGGCHPGRDPAAALERAVFCVQRLDSPVSVHIAGAVVAAG